MKRLKQSACHPQVFDYSGLKWWHASVPTKAKKTLRKRVQLLFQKYEGYSSREFHKGGEQGQQFL